MKINVRLLIILLVAGIVIVGSIGVLHSFQTRRQADGFLERARADIQKEDIGSGMRYYARYLQQKPNDDEVQAEYGILLMKQGNPNAIQYLEKAIRANPENKEVLQALADITMYQAGRFAEARGYLETLIELEPKDTDHREQLTKCLIMEGDLIKPEEVLLQIIKEDPAKLTSYSLLAMFYENKLKRPEDAQKLFDQMIEKNPTNAEAYRLRSIYFFTHKKREEAQKDLDKAIELAPKDKAVLLLASGFAESKGNLDKAKEYGLQLVEVGPESEEGYLQMAKLEGLNANFEKSIEWLNKGIDATEGTYRLHFQKADRLIDLNKIEKVEKELAKRSKANSIPPVLLAYLEARLSYTKENWSKARDQFEAVRPDLERMRGWATLAPRVDLFTAECHRQLGNPEKGKELTSRAHRTNVSTLNKDPLEEGRILRQEGKFTQAAAYFKSLTSHEPTKIKASFELFSTLLQKELRQKESQRDWSEVDKTLAEITEFLPDNPQATLLQVQTILAKNKENIKEAEAVLDAAVKRANTRTKQWNKFLDKVRITPDSRDIVQLIKVASETWAKKDPYMEKGLEFIEKGNRERALKILESGGKAQTNTGRLWITRIGLARSEKDWGRAEKITRKAMHILGDSALFRESLASIIVERGGDDAAAKLETVLYDINKLPKNQQQELWKFVAVLFNRLGKNDRAIELCETAAKQKPNDLYIRHTLFLLALEAGNKKVADKSLAQIEKIDQQGPYWHYLTALKISYPLMNDKEIADEDRGTIETAIDHLNIAKIQRPNWDKASLMLGKLYDKIGNTKAAATNFAQAVEYGDRDPVGLARLAEIYIGEGRASKAQNILDMIRYSKRGLNPNGMLAMAQMKLHQGDQRGAVAELMGAAELLRKKAAEGKDAKTYIELAQMLYGAATISHNLKQDELADSLRQEAQDMIVKASEVEPSSPRPWLILAKLYKDQGMNQKTDEIVMQIKSNVPEEMLHVSLALCYEVLERTVEAELACEKALAIANKTNNISRQVASLFLRSKQNNQNPKAEAALRNIIDGKLPASEEDIFWARRRLAIMLFSRGLKKDSKEAMKLVDKNLSINPKSLLDLRVKARGLATKGSRKDKQIAIKMLENLLKRPSPSDADRYQLVRLYWVSNNWSATSEQMRVLLGSANPQAQWYEFYTQCLINRNEFASAQTNWEKLNAMHPNAFVTANLKSLILAGNNQPTRAIAQLEEFIKNPLSTPDNELVKLNLVAQAAEGLATRVIQKNDAGKKERKQYLDFAEKCYREMAEKYSKNDLVLASFLGRHGKQDEAFELAEKSWKKNKPAAIAAATVRLLNTGNATPKQIARVEKIITEAIKHYGDDIALILAMAELRSMQKRYDKAESLYRKALKASPENVIALNNLAVFLALRKIKLDEAVQLINKAVEQAGALAPLLDSRASIYLAKGKFEEALDDIDTALQERRTNVRLFHQAQILMATGDKRGAKRSMEEALNLGFQVDQLQPLERPSYRALRELLK